MDLQLALSLSVPYESELCWESFVHRLFNGRIAKPSFEIRFIYDNGLPARYMSWIKTHGYLRRLVFMPSISDRITACATEYTKSSIAVSSIIIDAIVVHSDNSIKPVKRSKTY